MESFWGTLAGIPENLLASPSAKDNSVADIFPELFRILKASNAKGCSLLACNLLKRNSFTELFLDPFRTFPNNLRNLVRISFLVVLQSVESKSVTLVKRKFLEISRITSFPYITLHVTNFVECRIMLFPQKVIPLPRRSPSYFEIFHQW